MSSGSRCFLSWGDISKWSGKQTTSLHACVVPFTARPRPSYLGPGLIWVSRSRLSLRPPPPSCRHVVTLTRRDTFVSVFHVFSAAPPRARVRVTTQKRHERNSQRSTRHLLGIHRLGPTFSPGVAGTTHRHLGPRPRSDELRLLCTLAGCSPAAVGLGS